MKIRDNFKSYILLFLSGILAGVICRLSDFFHTKVYGVYPQSQQCLAFRLQV